MFFEIEVEEKKKPVMNIDIDAAKNKRPIDVWHKPIINKIPVITKNTKATTSNDWLVRIKSIQKYFSFLFFRK